MTYVAASSPTIQPDLGLFEKAIHSPSYASLTNNFEQADSLRDYCIPVNAYFPTPAILDALVKKLPYALKYYPSDNTHMADLVCRFADIDDPASVIVGNGSTELISWINTLFVNDNILVPVPSFGRWTDEPKGLGRQVRLVHYREEANFVMTAPEFVAAVHQSGTRNAVLCNPNNPTGSLMNRPEIIWIMEQLRHLDTLIIDESFIDFSLPEPPTVKDVVAQFPNAWVLKSLGKNLGLHGLRMGYAISHPDNIKRLKKHVPFWNVNGVTELLLNLVGEDKSAYEQSRLKVIDDRMYLAQQLITIDELTVFPSLGNFVYVKLAATCDGDLLRDRLLTHQHCLVRNCGNKIGAGSQYFRLAARPRAEVDYLVTALQAELKQLKAITFLADMQQAGCQISRFTNVTK